MLARADARFCSTRCRVAGNRADRIPKLPRSMTSQRRWVRHDATKRPITTSGTPASSTNPATWGTYREVRDSTVGFGIGFVLGGGIGCIDLDHCINDGRVAPWAQEIIDAHRDTAVLIEVSRSGEGVHIFNRMDPGRGRMIRDGRNIEIYPPESGRYIAVTGRPLH